MLIVLGAFLAGGGLLYVGAERSEFSFGIVGAVVVLVAVMAPAYAVYVGGASDLDRIAFVVTLAALIGGALLTVASFVDGGDSPVRFFSYLAVLALGAVLIVPAFWISDHQGLATQFNDQRDSFDDPAKPSSSNHGEMSGFADRAGLSLTERYYRCDTPGAPVAACPEESLQVTAEGYRVLRNSLFGDLAILLLLTVLLVLPLGLSEFRSADPEDSLIRPSLFNLLGEPVLAFAFGVSLMAAIASLSNSSETQADLGELAGSSHTTWAVWGVGIGAVLYMAVAPSIWSYWPGTLVVAVGFVGCGVISVWMLSESRLLWVGAIPATIAYGIIRGITSKAVDGRRTRMNVGPPKISRR